ncbi:hypothetical protein DICTH_1148 [Dictyoglomus thermophilum H-6-12]|uniref:Uncharacterized protein n=1 Tax=Dictyoglomus thermophilum (strain ATCC 35947 / DSM 3960 / H-6-12) TaxID=309799 RepID=B5YEM7_DICT6|nr:hypothetical protein DICTH_1148 [Dictyoglomus thermophilum H-6-12]
MRTLNNLWFQTLTLRVRKTSTIQKRKLPQKVICFNNR